MDKRYSVSDQLASELPYAGGFNVVMDGYLVIEQRGNGQASYMQYRSLRNAESGVVRAARELDGVKVQADAGVEVS